MTKKGEDIKRRILNLLERNPNGLTVTSLQKLLKISRNTIYRYLEAISLEGLINQTDSKMWILKEPIKPHTIPGYQYQAVFEGLKRIGGAIWDIKTDEGKNQFKELGKSIYKDMKFPRIDIGELQRRAHRIAEIYDYSIRLVQEAGTVERFKIESKLTKDGFPDPVSRLAGIVTFEGGYIASQPVIGNGFAHYYILSGVLEVYANEVISKIYGGRTIVNVIKIDEEKQIVDLGLYVIFDKETPYIDPKTLQKRVLT